MHRFRNNLFLLQILFEQFKDAFVFISPTGVLDEAVILNREESHAPVFLSQLDQLLRQPNRILEMDVGIDNTVADQKRPF